MVKRLFALIFTAAICISAAYAQGSQTIVVEVPFAFTTNNGTLPAGTYRIEAVGDSRKVWRLRTAGHKPGEFLLAMTLVGTKQGELGLTFHRYGDNNFLAGFKTIAGEVSLPATKREKELRSTSGPLAEIKVVPAKTEGGGGR